MASAILLSFISTVIFNMNVDNSTAFPGPCPSCGKGTYKSPKSREFKAHYNQCHTKTSNNTGTNFPGPCPQCGEGTYESSNCRKFTSHFSQCKKKRPCHDKLSSTQLPSAKVPRVDQARYDTDERYRNGITQSMKTTAEICHNSQKTGLTYEREFFAFGENDGNDDWASAPPTTEENKDQSDDTLPKAPYRRNIAIPGNIAFQIELNSVLQKHKVDLSLQDDIVDLLNEYVPSGKLNQDMPDLKKRESFLQNMEKSLKTEPMRPKHVDVEMADGSTATMSLFDIEMMIASILSDDNLMQEKNFAEGYDIYTGEVDDNHPSNDNYGEIHTGDAWEQARVRFCGADGEFMPIALVIFGDKTFTDKHGALAITPIIFTLTLFNKEARNKPEFWRPISYIPNMSYGKSGADKTESIEKNKDEQAFLRASFQSFRDINKRGGMRVKVGGIIRNAKLWIHFFIGDTEGNNNWMGHYNSSSKLQRPYRDCGCSFDQMTDDNPKCKYISRGDIRRAKKRKRKFDTMAQQDKVFKALSKHDIKLALMDHDIHLSDERHGIFRMMPPELLHTSGSGLIMYMFEVLKAMYGGGKDALEMRLLLDRLHQRIARDFDRQSDREFPNCAMRNGILDGTKCQAQERRGNFHRLLCISYTRAGKRALRKVFEDYDITWKEWVDFLKLYLAMEEWFHDSNPKTEVHNSRKLVAKVLKMMKKIFPREQGNSWNIPKHHGMTKMQFYMTLFGSAINFFGGPGESHHKQFVKAPAQNTQRRVSEFVRQVTERIYESMILNIASDELKAKDDVELVSTTNTNNGEEHSFDPIGKYIITVTEVYQTEDRRKPWWGKHTVKWAKHNKIKQNEKFNLKGDLLKIIFKEIGEGKIKLPFEFTGHTELRTEDASVKTTYHAHPNFLGLPWYDWCHVAYADGDDDGDNTIYYYPAKIMGFVTFPANTVKNEPREVGYAAVRTSTMPVQWEDLTREFIMPFNLSKDVNNSYVLVPFSAITQPLAVIEDYGGDNSTKHFACLPRQCWSRYFGDKIK